VEVKVVAPGMPVMSGMPLRKTDAMRIGGISQATIKTIETGTISGETGRMTAQISISVARKVFHDVKRMIARIEGPGAPQNPHRMRERKNLPTSAPSPTERRRVLLCQQLHPTKIEPPGPSCSKRGPTWW